MLFPQTSRMFWYWNRLRCMSFPEVAYRIQSHLLARSQKHGCFLASQAPIADLSRSSNQWIAKKHIRYSSDYCKEADRIIDGYHDVFAYKNLKLGHPVNWNKNPNTGEQAPLFFGKTLNYRDEKIVGDIKYLWEPSRHLHLSTLAQAYSVSNNKKYLDAIQVQLSSWFDQCPYMKGAHWTSSLELAIRLINWSIVWQLIGGDASTLFTSKEGKKFKDRWLNSIYQHTHFIKGHLSRYSSANNHLIGEATGLYVATITWPFWKQFDSWREQGKAVLENEAILQNDEDGVNREQAMSYQQFVLDFLILSGLAADANGDGFSKRYWSRIECMLEYLKSVTDVSGNVPMIGDADDGLVVRLSFEEDWNPYQSLLTIGAELFDRKDFSVNTLKKDDKYYWVIANNCVKHGSDKNKYKNKQTIKRAFKEGGYYILGNDLNKEDEIRLLVDAGPIGYREIAAHGHADALSIVLNYGGREFLIDPGTYSYHTNKKWREYFRGTSAHNTVRLDGFNQSTSGGNFMWSHKANAYCEKFTSSPEEDIFIGSHDGYKWLEDPVIHKRKIRYNKQNKSLQVTDIFECKGKHDIEQFWHFSEFCEIEKYSSDFVVINHERAVRISLPKEVQESKVIYGDKGIPLGWVSRQYDVKEPTNTLLCTGRINGNCSFTTTFMFD